jgi:hypothetical protein
VPSALARHLLGGFVTPDAAFQGRSLAAYQRPLPLGLVTFELNPPDRTNVSMPDLPNLS